MWLSGMAISSRTRSDSDVIAAFGFGWSPLFPSLPSPPLPPPFLPSWSVLRRSCSMRSTFLMRRPLILDIMFLKLEWRICSDSMFSGPVRVPFRLSRIPSPSELDLDEDLAVRLSMSLETRPARLLSVRLSTGMEPSAALVALGIDRSGSEARPQPKDEDTRPCTIGA